MYVADRDTYNDVFCQDCGNIADTSALTDDGLCEDCAVFHKTLDHFQAEDESKGFTFCVGCGAAPDPSVGENFELSDDGFCPECAEIEITDKELLPEGDVMLFCEACNKSTQHTQVTIRNFFVFECVVCPSNKQ